MEAHLDTILVTVVALGVGAIWLAWRTRVPAILLLSIIGLLVGPGLGIIDPGKTFGDLLPPVIRLCVAIILFEGGLSLQLHELKLAAVGVRRLVYLGAPLALILSSYAAHYIGGLSWPVSLVFGAIMVVTGPTVIIPMLRQAALNRRTASYLKWEAIVNDPIGALLAVLLFQYFVYAGSGSNVGNVASGVGLVLLSGGLLGGVGGWLTGKAFLHGFVPEYLKSPVMLSLVLVVYVVSNALQHEAGLLAVTIMGMVVGNMRLPGIQDMKRFKEYITVMLVAVVFILLTSDLEPEVFLNIDWRHAALIVAILFLTRPLTIMLATIGAGMDIRERLLLSWIAPRGIVAAATVGVMGPGMFQAGYSGAEALLPLVFGVIFATVTCHSLTINWLARRLGLTSDQRDCVLIVGASPWAVDFSRKLMEMEIPVILADPSWHALRPARLAGVRVFYGQILSDFADEAIEIAHVGTVLAATSNDAYNSLVCTAMAPEIGSQKTFQLPAGEAAEDDPKAFSRPHRGNIAFGNDILFEKLWRCHVRDWKFYRTRITESYTYSDFLGDFPAEATKILIVNEAREISFLSPQKEIEPGPGDIVLYYAPERQAPAAPENGQNS